VQRGPSRVYKRDPGHPEICNVFSLHRFYTAGRLPEIERDCRAASLGCVDCKRILAESMNESLAPFRAKRAEFSARQEIVTDVLHDGAQRARTIAAATMAEVREHMGLFLTDAS